MTYILQSNLAFALLYLVYRLFIKDLTFFTLNRWVLILIPLAALGMPLVEWKQGGEVIGGMLLPLAEDGVTNATIFPTFEWIDWFTTFYMLFGLMFLMVFAFRFTKLLLYLSSLEFRAWNGLKIASVDATHRSFSFFHFVVISKNEGIDQDRILQHETVHADYWHSLDRLISELVSCFFWANPFSGSYKKDVKNNCEFQVDDVLSMNSDNQIIEDLGRSQPILKEIELANSFISTSNLLKRIKMKTKKQSPSYKKAFYGLFLPAALIGVMIFSCSDNSSDNAFEFEQEVISGEAVKELTQMPAYVGGMESMVRYLTENIVYPKDAKEEGVAGTVFVQFVVETDGTINNVEVTQGVDDRLDLEAVRVIQKMPKWSPGVKGEEAVRVALVLPIKFSMPDQAVEKR
ncbi:MAG: M56 family metallopeptidase [Vicingaceae bacterium]